MLDSLKRSVTSALRPMLSRPAYIGSLEYSFLFVGLLLLGVSCAYRLSVYLHSQSASRAFSDRPGANQHRVVETAANPEQADFSQWSPGRIKAYRQSLHNRINAPIAFLEVEKIHLRVPVFAGTSEVALDRGAGWIAGTARPGTNGNIAIAGHRDGFFRGLKDLQTGDTITLNLRTEIDSYVVDRIEIVDPTDVSVLRQEATPKLTLVTCYPFYYVGSAPQRYILQAALSSRKLAAKNHK